MTALHTRTAEFTIERAFPASPGRVFAAWANPQEKASWSSCHDVPGAGAVYSLDFRVGGRELSRARPPGEPLYVVESLHHDIVPDERIVYSYRMFIDDMPMWISLVTLEFHAASGGTATRFTATEQAVLLHEKADAGALKRGTETVFDALVERFRNQTAQS